MKGGSIVAERLRVKDFFPEVDEYNPGARHGIDGCAEIRELEEYVKKLLGDEPSALKILDYARRLLRAAEVTEAWRKEKVKLDELFGGIRKSFNSNGSDHLPYGIVKYWNEANPSLQFGILLNSIEYYEALNDYHANTLRAVFGDPEGKFILAWHDFCHTGRRELIVHAGTMRRLAFLLLNTLEGKLNNSPLEV